MVDFATLSENFVQSTAREWHRPLSNVQKPLETATALRVACISAGLANVVGVAE